MLKPAMIRYDPKLWSRTAVKFMPRGSGSTHIVCDAVVVSEALASIREAHGWPLSLVAFRFERHAPGSRKGRVLVEAHAIDDLPRRVAAGNDYFYFVRDESRHPDLPGIDDPDAQAWLIINGLPLIIFNTRDADGGPGPATYFSIAGAIAHKTTSEIVRHEAEVEMYKALIAEVRKLVRRRSRAASQAAAAPAAEGTPMPKPGRSSKRGSGLPDRSKPRSPNSPPREGDVYAVRLEHDVWAFAHVLMIHRDTPKHGPFIRVFQTVKPEPTWDESIAASGERFRTFFPVAHALRDGCAVRVASMEVPEIDRQWPVFKTYYDKPKSEDRTWFRTRIDGPLNEKLGDTVPDDVLDAPFARVVNLIALSRLVRTNWTHRTEVRDRDRRG